MFDALDNGSEWFNLFYDDTLGVDEKVIASKSTIQFTNKQGIVFNHYTNARGIEIIAISPDSIASSLQEAKEIFAYSE